MIFPIHPSIHPSNTWIDRWMPSIHLSIYPSSQRRTRRRRRRHLASTFLPDVGWRAPTDGWIDGCIHLSIPRCRDPSLHRRPSRLATHILALLPSARAETSPASTADQRRKRLVKQPGTRCLSFDVGLFSCVLIDCTFVTRIISTHAVLGLSQSSRLSSCLSPRVMSVAVSRRVA